jgi:tetratricopeptide (TPR) repeat protein
MGKRMRLSLVAKGVGSVVSLAALAAAGMGLGPMVGPALAKDSYKLAAPIYPGAVPAMPAKGVKGAPPHPAIFNDVATLACGGLGKEDQENGPWCFLSRDPIEKVKAYYDKAIGPMRVMQGTWGRPPVPVTGYVVFAERAWFPGEGELVAPGYGYSGVSVHALPPPRKPQGQGYDRMVSYGHQFGGFVDAVDWTGQGTALRKPADLDAVYQKYGRLESAFFQRKGSDLEPVDETLRRKYDALRAERQQAAYSGTVSAQTQHGMAASQKGTAAGEKESAEFDRIMQRKPTLAQKYVALTQKANTLMQQGKFEEAEAVLDEVDQLEQSDPELAEFARKQKEREAGDQVADKAEEDRIRAAGAEQADRAIWGTAMEYIQAIDKEAYYTLIVIDKAFRGTEKDYSRDQALIAKETAGQEHGSYWGFQYEEAGSAQATSAPVAPAAVPAISPPAQQPEAEKKTDLGDAAKKGFNVLKKLWGN